MLLGMSRTISRSWEKRGAGRAAIQEAKVLGPHLRGVKRTQHRHRSFRMDIHIDKVPK